MGVKQIIRENVLYQNFILPLRKGSMERYFAQKTREYLALHKNLKSLDEAHKDNILAFWGRIFGAMGDSKITIARKLRQAR